MKNQDKLDSMVSPIIGPEAGERLRLVRQKMLMDQREMGDLLGLSQQQMSRLERGQLESVGFTLARFKAVFGKFYTFILFGSQVSSDNWGLVRSRYWDVRLKVKRKPGSGAWKKGNSKGVEAQREEREARQREIDLENQSDKKGSEN